ncbi:hypothetical protein EYB45_00090 [Erythrobacteraceae bacterium CFH 75059]|uniref:hypothetical protein n=1 Tax=Qipengyuania thermophila TaxID=2509361 RepID=UPI00101FDC3F|nr:hypothetical protein [Qipengyuania thermophila]TCD06187.1 hypothetical protein EYB45_00090 [Erythrobacteraceae bacterium CFH 75059]
MRRAGLIGAVLLALAACAPEQGGGHAAARGTAVQERTALGFISGLPIYWGEPDGVADALRGPQETHWARTVLEERHELVPLDRLGDDQGVPVSELAGLRHLFIAQPRAITAADNVALDRWVREGGRAILVLDPLVTEHSRYPLGDPRRFNDVALVPPVVARWGLAMVIPDNQQDAVTVGHASLPLDQHAEWRVLDGGGDRPCTIGAGGVLAICRVGEGRVLLVADTAFMDRERDSAATRAAFAAILALGFDTP